MGTEHQFNGIVLPDLMVVEDLCGPMRRSAQFIRRLLAAGEIPGRKIGGRWYIARRALLRAVQRDHCANCGAPWAPPEQGAEA